MYGCGIYGNSQHVEGRVRIGKYNSFVNFIREYRYIIYRLKIQFADQSIQITLDLIMSAMNANIWKLKSMEQQ